MWALPYIACLLFTCSVVIGTMEFAHGRERACGLVLALGGVMGVALMVAALGIVN